MARAQSAPATLLDYNLGNSEREAWASLQIRVDDLLDIHVGLSAMKARQFALDVIQTQGANLVYQPPNESMREWKDVRGRGSVGDSEPFWKRRERRERATRMLNEIRDTLGEDSLLWVLQEEGYR